MESEKKRQSKMILASTLIAAPLIIAAAFLPPQKSRAFSIFSPFGGKVESWNPTAPGCTAITAAVSAATLGMVNITIESLTVKELKGKVSTLGILRINGMTVPALTTIYSNYTYFLPGVNVLGNSINICEVCEKAGNLPGIKAICKIPAISKITEVGCKAIGGTTCPLTNLVHKIGSSLLPF